MTSHELFARQLKGERLAVELHAAGVHSGNLADLPPDCEFWPVAARAAGVRLPSAATIGVVHQLLRELEAAKR